MNFKKELNELIKKSDYEISDLFTLIGLVTVFALCLVFFPFVIVALLIWLIIKNLK